MSALFTTKDLDKLLKDINDDDLKKMFNSSVMTVIKAKPQEMLEEKLTEYWDYILPVAVGDVVEIDNDVFTVTCIYTDNSVDLLNNTGTSKLNKGLYNVPIVHIGKLECITV